MPMYIKDKLLFQNNFFSNTPHNVSINRKHGYYTYHLSKSKIACACLILSLDSMESPLISSMNIGISFDNWRKVEYNK